MRYIYEYNCEFKKKHFYSCPPSSLHNLKKRCLFARIDTKKFVGQ